MTVERSETQKGTLTAEQRDVLERYANEVEDIWELYRDRGWNEGVCNAMTLATIQLIGVKLLDMRVSAPRPELDDASLRQAIETMKTHGEHLVG